MSWCTGVCLCALRPGYQQDLADRVSIPCSKQLRRLGQRRRLRLPSSRVASKQGARLRRDFEFQDDVSEVSSTAAARCLCLAIRVVTEADLWIAQNDVITCMHCCVLLRGRDDRNSSISIMVMYTCWTTMQTLVQRNRWWEALVSKVGSGPGFGNCQSGRRQNHRSGAPVR